MFRQTEDGQAFGSIAYPSSDFHGCQSPDPKNVRWSWRSSPSRGDFGEAPDLGLDKVSAALTYRPTWSNIPSGEEDERNITRLT